MNTRIIIAAAIASFVSPIAFGQMSGGYSQPQSQPPQPSSGGMSKETTTTTKTTMPVGVKGYLDSQLASSKDKKFHVTLNGKDLALSPVKFGAERKLGGGKSSTAVDMKGVDGKIYEIDFVSSGGQVTGASVAKVNGKSPSSQ
ncbi:MAG TPA: hypothetical protein VNW72_09335 [Chthoniobacterales bacterium]|jgi:hypothetical protein|nr:hypothetical protein [Chthoniobacterales bacterium]